MLRIVRLAALGVLLLHTASCAKISCVTGSDCSTGCCAPEAEGDGLLTGPYICQDESQCCDNGGGSCPGSCAPGSGFACVTDSSGNSFCAQVCDDSSTCSGGNCDTFGFAHSACSGPTACGP